jgi:hypothetical protein
MALSVVFCHSGTPLTIPVWQITMIGDSTHRRYESNVRYVHARSQLREPLRAARVRTKPSRITERCRASRFLLPRVVRMDWRPSLSPTLTLISDGKKFMWDGRLFETQDASLREAAAYEKENFEVRTVEREGQFLVYTRRIVKEHVLTET